MGQSIDFFAEPNNLTKTETAKVNHWLVAGISEKNIDRFQQIARKVGISLDEESLSNKGYGIDNLKLASFQPGSRSKFKQLQRIANQLDLELWQEVEQVNEQYGVVNQNLISEGAFD